MDTTKDTVPNSDKFLPIPDKLVWAVALMGIMVLITFVSV